MTCDRSRLAFGCCPLGGHGWSEVDTEQIERAIHEALDYGIDIFDTADVYGFGLSETRLGQALGKRRYGVRIVTKVGLRRGKDGCVERDGRPSYIRDAVIASLRRLRIEVIPIVLLHWPDPRVPISDSIGSLSQLQKEGLIASYGASNLSDPEVAVPWSQNKVSLLTGPLRKKQRGLVGSMAWGTLEQGLLAGAYRHNLAPDDRRRRESLWSSDKVAVLAPLLESINSVAQQIQTSMSAVAVSWVLARGGVDIAVVGIKSLAQWSQLVRNGTPLLDESHVGLLEASARRVRHILAEDA